MFLLLLGCLSPPLPFMLDTLICLPLNILHLSQRFTSTTIRSGSTSRFPCQNSKLHLSQRCKHREVWYREQILGTCKLPRWNHWICLAVTVHSDNIMMISLLLQCQSPALSAAKFRGTCHFICQSIIMYVSLVNFLVQKLSSNHKRPIFTGRRTRPKQYIGFFQ